MKLTSDTLIQQITKTVHLNYLVHIPAEAWDKPLKRWPTIFFLHGAGERGSDLELVRSQGLLNVMRDREDFPFIVIAPQCPSGLWWTEMIDALDALLVQSVSRYPIDLDRMYLTGLSMGGFGAWRWAMQYPQRFAAVAPICGGGDDDNVCVLKDTPIWAFHGAKDPIVPVSETVQLVENLQACGSTQVKMTIYPDAEHDSWTQTYANPELYEWFLQNQRVVPLEPPTGKTAAGETPAGTVQP